MWIALKNYLYQIKSITLVLILCMGSHVTYAKSSTIGIIVFDDFLTSDVTAPIEVFGAASKHAWFSNYQIVLISATEERIVTSEEGLSMVADKTIADAMDLDVLIVPSAYDMKPTLNNKALIQFIEEQHKQASWVSSNCSGAYLLGEAGVLDGKKVTTWFGGEKLLAKKYPKADVVYDQNVVVDKGLITSNGGPVSYQAAFEILSKLSSEKYAKEIADQIQFNRLSSAF